MTQLPKQLNDALIEFGWTYLLPPENMAAIFSCLLLAMEGQHQELKLTGINLPSIERSKECIS